MKGMLRGVAALALATTFAATTAQAQGVTFGVGGTGDFSLETGGGSIFGGTVLVQKALTNSPLGIRVDGTVEHKSGITPFFGTADLMYTFKTSESSMIHPYLLAGGGIYHASSGGVSFTKPMAKGGVGFDYALSGGKMAVFGEGTFNLLFRGSGAGTAKSLQANVGVKFTGGK